MPAPPTLVQRAWSHRSWSSLILTVETESCAGWRGVRVASVWCAYASSRPPNSHHARGVSHSQWRRFHSLWPNPLFSSSWQHLFSIRLHYLNCRFRRGSGGRGPGKATSARLDAELPVMIQANGRRPGCRKVAGDAGIFPAPGAMGDASKTRPEEIAGDQADLTRSDQDNGQDEKLEQGHVHYFTTLQSFPNRPRRARRMSSRNEISSWWRIQMSVEEAS